MINLQVRLAETVQNVGILKVTSQPIITISDLFLYISSPYNLFTRHNTIVTSSASSEPKRQPALRSVLHIIIMDILVILTGTVYFRGIFSFLITTILKHLAQFLLCSKGLMYVCR